jgi:alginate O-acetyltransferase complex protein AlgF
MNMLKYIGKTLSLIAAIGLLTSFASFSVSAEEASGGKNTDTGLYDPLPPANSAFVRFFRLTGTGDKLFPTVAAKAFPASPVSTATFYGVIKEGKTKITAGKLAQDYEFKSGKLYTIVLGDKITVIEDPAVPDKLKAQVIFYNLTKADLSLKALENKVELVPVTKPMTIGSRAINALRVDFSVIKGTEDATKVPAQILERGQSYAIFAVPDGAGVKAVVVQASTNTRL